MNPARRVVKNASFLIFSGMTSQLLAFVGVVYLAHVLGPEKFGTLNFALALTVHFALLTNLGLTRLGTKELARHPELIGQYAANITAMRLCMSVIGLLALMQIVFLLDRPLEVKYLIVLFGAGLLPGAILLDWAFQGTERMEYIALSRILTITLYTVCLLVAVKDPSQLLRIPCFQVGANLVTALVLIVLFKRCYPHVSLCLDFSLWKPLFQNALPLGIALILVQMIYYIDTVILGFMRTDVEIGYYNAAYKIIIVCIGTAGNFFESMFPMMSRYYQTDIQKFIQVQTLNLRIMIAIAIPLVFGGILLAQQIIISIFGIDYGGSIFVFKYLIWIPAIAYINTVYAWGLWAMDMHVQYMKVVALQVVVNIVSNILLIPDYGIFGAAIATILSELIGFPFYFVLFNRKVQLPMALGYITKPLLSSFVMGIILYIMIKTFLSNAFLLVLSGGVVYIGAMLLLNGITRDELKMFRKMIATG